MISLMNQSTQSNDGQTTVDHTNDPPLLPNLPNHLAQIILSTIQPTLLYAVCRQWRRLIYTPQFPSFLSLYAVVASTAGNDVSFFTFDPISGKWTPLPSPEMDPPIHFLHHHPSFISRNLTIQSLIVCGFLVLIAATGHDFFPALSHPLVFDPLTGEWFRGPLMTNPRRWCAVACVNDTVYVASGVGAQYRGDVARLVEKWDVKKRRDEWRWEEVVGLKDGQFSRESVEGVAYKGKICMVNVKGNAGKEGVVYDIMENRWEKMANGMVSGWDGPVCVARSFKPVPPSDPVPLADLTANMEEVNQNISITNDIIARPEPETSFIDSHLLSASASMHGEEEEEEEVMYLVNETTGGVRKYDDENDCWKDVIEGSELLKGAEQMAIGGGKICVVSHGRIIVVDVVAKPVKMWVVDPPRPECEVISVHILGRPCIRL
ncbi:F-box/kelch-repeat protein SKIP25-like protein [Tanacetum coccineum]|uniref:F-box/kelch-repeat protein SKIP25-like protein n=1 Tax=Tanacetum coccineum TaxID=301880 RepID=A0ABQ5G0M9_9ASTR